MTRSNGTILVGLLVKMHRLIGAFCCRDGVVYTSDMRPVIGITSGEVRNQDRPWAPIVYGQSFTYVETIIRAGGVPVMLPITADETVVDRVIQTIDGIVLAGGNDITPELYGVEARYTKDNSRLRDECELLLLRKAESKTLPILAICRGMQLLNVARKGTLYEDITEELPGKQNHRASLVAKDMEHIAHLLTLEKDSRLARIFGQETIRTNTYHHQAVREVGRSLVVNARAEDGIIEGLEDPLAPFIIGVQSHPEAINTNAEPAWLKLFEAFIAAARQKS